MTITATSATVTFSGARGGEAALTWGQRHTWRALRLHGPGQYFLNCPWVLPVYARRDLGAVLNALRALIERQESLRTTFADTPAGPVQRVARSGELTVRLEQAGQERSLELAERLAAQMSEEVFAPGEEWPLRCRVLIKEGRPAALACAFSHLAVDHMALALLSADWRRLMRGEDLPPANWQPMDQTRLEATEPFQARSARSVRCWQQVLDEVPLDVFDHPPGKPEDPRFIEVSMESPALGAAVALLAKRWAISTSSVLLAACATVLAAVSGRPRAVMLLPHSNRRDPRTRAMVGAVIQDSLFVLDLGDADFAATCRAAERNALLAYRNTQYDPFAVWAMREETGRRRGREPDLNAFFNDRLGSERPDLSRAALGQNLAGLAGKTSIRASNAWPSICVRVMFTVGTTAGASELSLIVDTAYLTRDIATSMLLGIEALIVRSLTEDIPVAAIPQVCGIAAYRGHR
jgi:condensation domain-containing protein